MASVNGGQFVIAQASGTVTLGLKDATNPVFPAAVVGNLNIEVFTASGLSTLPALDSGFTQGILDAGGDAGAGGFLRGTVLTLFGGDYQVTDSVTGSNAPARINLGSGTQAVTGAPGDTLVGGSGSGQVLNALAGNQTVTGGTGSYAVFGGNNVVFNGPSSGATSGTTAQIVGFSGLSPATNMQIGLPTAGNYTISGAAGQIVTAAAGSANVQINAFASSNINLTGNVGNEVIIATAGNVNVTTGGGNANVFGGVGDVITMGAGGNQYTDATAGGMRVNVGAGGSDTIVGGANVTINGGGANLALQGLGSGSTVNLAAQTGAVGGINATAGNISITLGGVTASVFGGSGDVVTGGSVGQYIDARSGGMSIALGSGGTETVFGSNVAGLGNSITGGSAALSYMGGSGGAEFINLAGTTGSATINSFTGGSTAGDQITLGNGTDSVWGGAGDRIGVGVIGVAGAGGIHLWDHSSVGGAIGFGTNATTTGSTALVTVTSFNTVTDTVFYASRTASNQDATIVGSASSTVAGTTITLPDGTTMFFAAVANANLLTFTA